MMKMTSSTEIAFSAVTYPSLKAAGQDRTDSVAYANGHTAGYTAGLRLATAEAEARRQNMEAEHAAALRHSQARTDRAVEVLAGAAQAVYAAVLPVVTDAQDALAAAAMDLAETVIGVELGDGDLSARAAIARALAGAPANGLVTVKLNPVDFSVLGDAAVSGSGAVIVADPAVARGDAVADFEHGHLNARIGTALDRARQALLGVQP